MGAARWCLGLGPELWTPKVKVHSSAPPRQLEDTSSSSGATPAEPAGEGDGGEVGAGHTSEQREVFTIWMKSLVLNGSGCTVFDSDGRIVYWVDNYSSSHSVDICLMDIMGSVVLQVLKRFGRWDGYKLATRNQKSPMCHGGGHDGRREAARASWIVDDATGVVVVEVKRKLTVMGLSLGEDVLMLVVEPNVDHSLIMGLLVVHGLINHSM
ncbi:hypothetical protein ACQ4PT_019947 [Festuca glaucescens]